MKAGLHIAIVGSGNVGHHLQKALKGIATVHSVGRDLTVPEACEIVMVCVPDDSVARVCEQLPENKLVVHTAGAVPMQGNNRSGVFYPLYSFSKDAEVNWSQIPILLEANSAEDLSLLKELATQLTEKVFEVSSAGRNQLHVSAVLVNNFTNHLYTLAFDHAKQHNVPVETLFAIMRQGPEKAIQLGPINAQTGPAIRGDQSTIEAHLSKIQDEELKTLYQLLSDSIHNTHNR
jgi:predicted short-subunit dehydrogenase-like oxidoreductase (DUF2520 family)